MFDPSDPTIIGLKVEFRERFRNISRVMDCVGCDKCRLWGKLQTSGYGTALKVLFELDTENAEEFYLRRTEVVSLIVTLQRLSHSIWAMEKFRDMIRNPISPPFSLKEKLMRHLFRVQFNSFGDAFKEEVHAIFSAAKYVFRSYVSLPVNLWKTGIVYMGRIWDQFIIGASAVGKARLTFDNILR